MKLIRYCPLVLFLCLFISFFYSCSEEPITPPVEDFDPPRFNWRSMDIYYHGFAGMWAWDTSKIFLLNHYNRNLYIVSGGNVTMQYIGNYYLNEIKGLSNNQVYFFGAGLYDRLLTIIKWNGAGFEYYTSNIFVNYGNAPWIRGCAVNSNEIWICSQDGISKFDGVNMTNYSYEDPLLIPNYIFLTNDKKVQYISERWMDSAYIQQSLFEFRDTGFVRMYNYIIKSNSRSGVFLEEVGGYKFGLELNQPLSSTWSVCIKYFTGSSFTPYFCFNDKITNTGPAVTSSAGLVGMNPQNFIFLVEASNYGFFDPPARVGIIHWNGNKVSKEIGLKPTNPYPYLAFILFAIDYNNYIVLQPRSEMNELNNTLYIATKK